MAQNQVEVPGGVVDLDAATTARAEEKAMPITVRFRGEIFEIDPEPPFELAEKLAALIPIMDQIPSDLEANPDRRKDVLQALPIMMSALEVLLGEENWTRFRALRPKFADMMNLIGGVMDKLSFGGLGESPASDASS